MMDNTASTGQLFPGLTGCQTCSGIKVCWDWPAVFSTNNRREIWPFVTNGYTPEENRKQVRGESRVIDEVADFYLKVRNDGGRFFIDDLGAYYKNADIGEGLNLFVWFRISK